MSATRMVSIRLIGAGIVLVTAVTLLHFFAWWIAPFESINPDTHAWIGILVFNGIIVGTFCLAILALWLRGKHEHPSSMASTVLLKTRVNWLLFIACIGVALHILAKASLINLVLDNGGGLGTLRNEWLRHQHADDPLWLRAASMSGYVGSHFAMPGLFITAFHIIFARTRAHALRSWLHFLAFWIVVLLFSLAIVSRTVVLTALVLCGLASLIALCERFSAGSLVRSFTIILVGLAIAGSFNGIVFINKINHSRNQSDLDGFTAAAVSYTEGNIIGQAVRKNEASALIDLCPTCLPTLHYLNHGIWNYAAITATSLRGDPVLLAFVGYYLSRMGLFETEPSGTRVYGRGGVTLPGAAYHDYGWPGVIITALVLVACWLVATQLILRAGRYLWLGLTLLAGTGLTLAMSILFVAPATISFPFVIFSFLVCTFIDRLTDHRNRWANKDLAASSL